jgi:hypothetical protein
LFFLLILCGFLSLIFLSRSFFLCISLSIFIISRFFLYLFLLICILFFFFILDGFLCLIFFFLVCLVNFSFLFVHLKKGQTNCGEFCSNVINLCQI